MSTKVDLSAISTDDLVSEILSRPGIAATIFNVQDAKDAMNSEGDLDHLDEDQMTAAGEKFLNVVGKGLGDILGSRGNDYLMERWEDPDVQASVLGSLGLKTTAPGL